MEMKAHPGRAESVSGEESPGDRFYALSQDHPAIALMAQAGEPGFEDQLF